MTDQHSDIASVADRARRLQADGTITAIHFLGDIAAFVLGEEAVLLVDETAERRRVPAHAGAILASAADGERLVTGGDDGKVAAIDRAGTVEEVAVDAKRRWIDRLAIGPGGMLAWSAGRQAVARSTKGTRTLDVPSTVGALAFAPKGVRLAVAHYNGVTLWFPNAPEAKPETLAWKGSHLVAAFSPDGRFLVTAMQEPTLHAWRLADRKDMRMQGYASRVRSIDWTADGKWLASSGASQLILWPFQSRDGPMGKAAQALAPAQAPVEAVACHPGQPVIAAGYADGLILLVRREDGAEILAHRPGGAPVTALAWDRRGAHLAFACEDGEAGIVDLR
jgi:WD40 repeat protein